MNKIQNQLNIIRLDENKAKTNLTLPIQDIISSSNSRLINTLRKNILEFEKELHSILTMQYSELLNEIETTKTLTDPIKEKLDKAIQDCQKLFIN